MEDTMSVKDRVGTIGGSDAPAILGLSPFSTALQVARQTLGLDKPKPSDSTMDLGTDLEAGIRAHAERLLGKPITTDWGLCADDEHEYLVGHLDGSTSMDGVGDVGVEIKKRSDDGWGDDGTDRVPPDVLIQCSFYMGITGLRGFHVFNLPSLRFGMRAYWLPRNDDLVKLVIARCVEFYQRIHSGWLPPPTNAAEARTRWETETGKRLTLDVDSLHLATFQEWRDARAARLDAAKREGVAKLAVLELLGDCAEAWLGDHPLAAVTGARKALRIKKGLELL